MNKQQLQQALAVYTDKWISEQHQAERSTLRMERRSLEAQLAQRIANEAAGRKSGVLTLRGVRA